MQRWMIIFNGWDLVCFVLRNKKGTKKVSWLGGIK